ncbi:MAG: AMIN domain-containing protein [Candidatus Sulfotelmatobacter sp.]
MYSSLRAAAALLFLAAVCFLSPVATHAQAVPSIRRVQLLRSGAQVEIEIEASERIIPQTNVLTGPDRLVVDFVNARPSAQLRNLSINRAEVKNLRVGLFSSDPPVTRLVLDLNGPQPYQVFPAGRTIMLKIGGSASVRSAGYRATPGPVLLNANYPTQPTQVSAPPPPAGKPRLEVSFQDGLLSISSNKANLSEILFAIHQRTGAEIAIPAGAEQDEVAADFGPGPAPEVLAHLLNGSKFNFMILSSPTDPHALDRVILSPRSEGPISAARSQAPPAAVDEDSDATQSNVAPPVRPSPGSSAESPILPAGSPETKPPDSGAQD